MKYNIFDFSQEKVISLSKKIIDNGKEKTISLDVSDLLILLVMSDFINRKKIIKYTIDDKTYFSIQYKVILDDLPILNIKQQALTDRINKMVMLGVLEKKIIKNQTGSYSVFRMGDEYEKIKYSCINSGLQVQEYLTTSAEVVDYKPKDYSTSNNSTNKKEDTIVSKKEVDSHLSNSDPRDAIDYEYIKSAWEQICPMLSSIRELNPKRKRAIANTLKNNKATTEDMIKCFKIIASNDFCTGVNSKQWKATFDWIINDTKSCFNRLLEGEFSKSKKEHDKYNEIINGKLSSNTNDDKIIIDGIEYK